MYIAPRWLKTQRHSDDRAKPSKTDRPVRTARTFVHHHNSTLYDSTEIVFFIFPFLKTNITSQMWPSGGGGGGCYYVPEIMPHVAPSGWPHKS